MAGPASAAPASHVAPSALTVAAIAVVAYAACDMLHEVLGHGVATLIVPGVHALTLTTVAISTSASSRIVAAAGSLANLLAGVVALALARRGTRPTLARYFAWLFGSLNLLNATGYPLFSGLLDFGDWAVVIDGLAPHLAWRGVLVVAGIAAYVSSIRVSAGVLSSLIGVDDVRARQVHRYIMPAYLAGGLLLVAGSIPNPAGPSLILLSGASSGFGAMAGLLAVPAIVERRGRGAASGALRLGPSVPWLIAAIVTAAVFVFVIGPGIKLG